MIPVGRADIDAQSAEGCMKGTRVNILKDLRTRSYDRRAPPIYWLNGMAGTSKSAIVRSFCHVLHQIDLLGGSFFCSRGGSVEEGDAQRIIVNLAASMATCSKEYHAALSIILKQDLSPVHWNLQLWIDRLLRIPFSTLADDARQMVLIVDALDECSDEDVTRDLIARLIGMIKSLPNKVFLTSGRT